METKRCFVSCLNGDRMIKQDDFRPRAEVASEARTIGVFDCTGQQENCIRFLKERNVIPGVRK